jgi:hypothetical protein
MTDDDYLRPLGASTRRGTTWTVLFRVESTDDFKEWATFSWQTNATRVAKELQSVFSCADVRILASEIAYEPIFTGEVRAWTAQLKPAEMPFLDTELWQPIPSTTSGNTHDPTP